VAVDQRTNIRQRLRDIEDLLRPDVAHHRALGELDHIFRGGRTPDPMPDGMLDGRVITSATWAPIDAAARRLARMWMPWLGKTFDAATLTGVNVLSPGARGAMRLVWPSYDPERETDDAIYAFPFRNRVAPGELDSGVDVLKIDYDFERNPQFVVRRILDELVQVDDGFYLGKILFRRQGAWASVGYFTLERRAADE